MMALNTTYSQQSMSEINVTPLVDVMLVLLAIFIVTAPLLMQAVPVDLPKTNAATPLTNNAPLQLTIDATGCYFLDRNKIEPNMLEKVLRERKTGETTTIQINADQKSLYGNVAKALAIINRAGIHRITFVTIRS